MGERTSGRKILFAVSDSCHSRRAFDYFFDHLARHDDRIIFLHVVRPCYDVAEEIGYSVFTSFPEPTTAMVQDQRAAEGKRICSAFVEKAQGRGFPGARGAIAISCLPGDAIINAADRHQASMIVMGTQSKNLWWQCWNGSISNYVKQGTTVVVETLPPKNG